MLGTEKTKTDYYDIAVKALFVFYLAAMTWIILFKFALPEQYYSIKTARVLNLIPFNDLLVGKPMSVLETIGNIIIFLPFGIFISMLIEDKPVKDRVLLGMMLSICYETIQFILSIGVADATDVLTNTVGCAVGIGLYILMKKIIRSEFKMRRFVVICSAAVCVPSMAMLPMLSTMWIK